MIKFWLSLLLVIGCSIAQNYKYVNVAESFAYDKYGSSSKDQALVMIDVGHVRIHQGQVFEYTYFIASVGNNDSLVFKLTTDTFSYHLRVLDVVGGNFEGRIYAGSGTITDSAAVIGLNRNGNYALTSLNIDFKKITCGTLTGLAVRGLIAGGKGPQSGGGFIGTADEFIVAPSTTLFICYKNISGGAQPFSFKYNFYKD